MSPMPAKWNNQRAPEKIEFVRGKRPDVALVERHCAARGVMRDVGFAPADEIVDNPNPVAAFAQHVDHVAADESGAPGDDRNRRRCSHWACRAFSVFTL